MAARDYNKPVFQFIILSFCIVFGAFIVGSMFFAKESIEQPFLLIETACGAICIGGLALSLRIKNINQLLFCVFVASFAVSLATRLFFLDYYQKPFGLAVDSYNYDKMVIPLLQKGFSHLNKNLETDDLGYTFTLYNVYKLAGWVELGRGLMLLLNSSLLVGSSYLLFRLALIMDFSVREAIIAAGLYGFNPFLYVNSSVGLKEVIFCFLIIASLFFMLKWKLRKGNGNLILCLGFIISTLFFRTVICLMLLICLALCIVINDSNKKKMLRIMVIAGICSPIFANIILEAFADVSLEHVMRIAQARNTSIGSGSKGLLVQVCAAFLGPFPNFFKLGKYALLFSGGILLKSILNLFYFIGVWKVIQNLDYKFFPPALYSVFGIILVMLSGVALDMRFAITFLPAMILIVLHGIRGLRMSRYFYLYLTVLVIITAFYNVR